MKKHEKPNLTNLVTFWQPILRLADWDIKAKYVRHLDRSGWCWLDVDYKKARVRLIDPIDWQGSDKYDVEYHLVHELVHPHFAAFKIENGSPLHLHEEQAVTSLTRAMIQLRRMH